MQNGRILDEKKKSEQRRQGNLAEINGTRLNKTERTSEKGETSQEEENENEYPENHTEFIIKTIKTRDNNRTP